MIKIVEQNGRKAYDITEYVADSFEDLPKNADFGDRAIFNDNGILNIAIYLSNGWVRGS
jgi:hypothetical protein